MSFCFLKEKSLCLGTSYKTKDVFIRSSYYYYCEKPAWDVESHSLHVKVSDFAPFVVRTRIIKITHAHNLHGKMLDFVPFTIRTYKTTQIQENNSRKFPKTILKNHLGFTINVSAIKLHFKQR